jgi:hypothetical protein
MRLDEQRLEDPFIRLDLALQLEIFLGTHARLALVRQHVVQIARIAIGTQNRAAEAAFLPRGSRHREVTR